MNHRWGMTGCETFPDLLKWNSKQPRAPWLSEVCHQFANPSPSDHTKYGPPESRRRDDAPGMMPSDCISEILRGPFPASLLGARVG